MWGIGPKTAPSLRALGYGTLGDLARADPRALERALGSWGPEVQRLARGDDPREVVADREAKSIGAESTYDVDLTTREAIARSLLAHAARVAERLTSAAISARVVVVKIKLHDFRLLSRRLTLPAPASDTRTLHDACVTLLERFPLEGARVRLTGVSVAEIGPSAARQPTLFGDPRAERRREVESVLLRAKQRYGNAPITFASLLEDVAPRTAPEGDLERFRRKP
jgi:DNA polymerase-4